MEQRQEDIRYCLPKVIAEQCLGCCIHLRDGILSNPQAQDAFNLAGHPEIIDDIKEFIDYMQALVDSGVPTITIPEEMKKVYNFLWNLTMKIALNTIIDILDDVK